MVAKGKLAARIAAVLYAALHMSLVAVFLVFPLLALLNNKYRPKGLLDIRVTFIYSLIWIAAFIQAVLVLGENNRFRTSVEPYILGLAVWFVAIMVHSLFKKTCRLDPGDGSNT